MNDADFANGISSPPELGRKAVAAKLEKLRTLEVSLRAMDRNNRLNPLGQLRGNTATVIGLGALLALAIIDRQIRSLLTFLPVAIAVIAFFAMRLIFGLPRTPRENVDRLLNEYEPILLERFVQLQKSLLQANDLVVGEIERWLTEERAAVNEALSRLGSTKNSPPPQDLFLSRKITPD